MFRRTVLLACLLIVTVWVAAAPQHAPQTPKTTDPKIKVPSDGYTIHVTAPHLVNGKEMGPFHHYCKVHTPDPLIVCLIYESDDPNAMLAQVEWIWAKKLVRNQVSRAVWNKNWHDHQVEIAGGRVKVLDLPEADAKKVADIVATTDGLIYTFHFDGQIPNGQMSISQAVGHRPLTDAEYKKSQAENK